MGIPVELAELPGAWRSDPLLLAEWPRWRVRDVVLGPDALLLVIDGPRGVGMFGRGAPTGVADLVRRTGGDVTPGRMTVPRGTGDLLTAADLAALGVAHCWDWDWLLATRVPDVVAGEERVEALDRLQDADAIRECLAVANPATSARPGQPSSWFGVRGRGGHLLGVVSARAEGGPRTDVESWHLQGLAVLPEERGAGLGAALTAAVMRAGLERRGLEVAGSWVSLGMYADNDPARRVYDRLGFRVHAEGTTFGAVENVGDRSE